MLVLLVVLALVPTWSDGLLLNKCELKSQLEAALSMSEDIIAKVVCTIEQTSGFNTSLVTITDQFKLAEVQPEKSIVHVDGQARKQREAPSKDERDGSWRSIESSGEGSTDWSEEKQDRNGLDETVVPQIFPDPTDIYGDTYEMLFGSTLPPENTMEPDIIYDTYEMLYGSRIAPDRTAEPEDIHYDTYEMIFGISPKSMNPLDRSLDTTEPLGSKQSSEDQTTLYGIFQLSDMVCNSESSHSLANLCGLDCSALIDDDISDDIACLMTLDEKWWMMRFTQECATVEPSHYFAECD